MVRMTDYKASKRIVGTSAERTALNVASPAQTSWKELTRVTTSSTGTTIDTGTFTAKDNIMILTYDLGNTSDITTNGNRQFNSNTGSNYALRRSANGGSDSTVTSTDTLLNWDTEDNPSFSVEEFANISNQEKLVIHHSVHQHTAGAGTAPYRVECVGKWANTSNQVTSYQIKSDQNFNTGSEIVVLGYDNDEADSGTNFWQELANVTLGSAGDTLDTSTITAKKYLWIQAFIPEGAGHHGYIYFNNDTGSNYARRGSINGGSDITNTSDNEINWSHDTNTAKYLNMFVVNKSDKEKLCIADYMDYGSSGAGNAPNRIEWVYKWANTSDQITSVKLYNNQASSNDFPIGTKLKVWGAD